MPAEKPNPFMQYYDKSNSTQEAVAKPEPAKVEPVEKVEPKAPVERHEKGRPSSGLERDASVLYRLNKGFYKEIKIFAELKHESVNALIEMALLSYMTNKENAATYALTKQTIEKNQNN